MSRPGTIAWFAAHEVRLVWRDAFWMVARRRLRGIVVAGAVFAVFVHGVAYAMVGNLAGIGRDADSMTLASITLTLLLGFSLMLSQALESATRAFYARADLDLILSSPTDADRLFAVRIAAIGGGTAMTAAMIAAPFIDVLVWRGGPRWIAAYGVVVAMGLMAGAFGVALTVALFRLLGPARTRIVAQVLAAVIGAAFLIGIQALGILSLGTLSRYAVLEMPAFRVILPSPDAAIWWPARAVIGEPMAVLLVCGAGAAALLGAILLFAPGFAAHATQAASIVAGRTRHQERAILVARSPARALRSKEWALLRRDPWLLSQTLMQILYLLPPALLLWHNYGEESGSLIVLVPVLVMAAGQLAGGLAWLAVSGEDAPDLMGTAPVGPGHQLRAKVEAVLAVIIVLFVPLLAALALVSTGAVLFTALGIAGAAASATAIQIWFRAQAKRSTFRRRQTASRAATFAEAFSSISWAGAAVLAAAGTWLAVPAAAAAAVVLLVVWTIRPSSAG